MTCWVWCTTSIRRTVAHAGARSGLLQIEVPVPALGARPRYGGPPARWPPDALASWHLALSMLFLTWVRTVASETHSFSAISGLVSPSETKETTSRSRRVSSPACPTRASSCARFCLMITTTATRCPSTTAVRAAYSSRTFEPSARVKMRTPDRSRLAQSWRHSSSSVERSAGVSRWPSRDWSNSSRDTPKNSHVAAFTARWEPRLSNTAIGFLERSTTPQKSRSQPTGFECDPNPERASHRSGPSADHAGGARARRSSSPREPSRSRQAR